MKKSELQAGFEAVFSNSYQAILYIAAGYEILDYNPAAADWIKKAFGKIINPGDSFLEYLPKEDIDELSENIQRTLDEGNRQYKLFSIIKSKDETEYWTEYQFYPVIIDSVFTGLYVFIFDITERKNVIDEVARSTRRFYSLIKNSSDIVSVLDAAGTIHFISNSVQKILGYLPGEITGKNFMDYIFPADYENFKTAFSRSLSQENKSFVSQFRFQHREGYWVFLESLGSNHLNDESINGIILNSRDITDRRHFEEMLKKISRQNELILESAGEGIYGINREGRITFVNPAGAEMLGFGVEDIIGKNHFEVIQQVTVDGDPCPEDRRQYYTAMVDGISCSVDDAFFMKSGGNIYPIEYIATPIKEKGQVVGMVVTFNDISERKRNEEELLKAKEEADAANRAKSEFLANMSHEIRTPIHNILGFLEMLDSTELDKTQREYVTISRESTRTLLDIISDILDYSKIEKGKIEIEVSEFNPGVLFESTVELFSATAAERNLNYYTFIDPGLPDLLVGDSLRIRQVMNNLIGNAMKFTPRKGEVYVEIVVKREDVEGCSVSFSVRDTGIGIAREKQQYIFRSFTQADSSVARKYGGTGLGLAISSNLVKLMGGNLQLESRPNKGSRFYFDLFLPFSKNLPAKHPRRHNQKGITFFILKDRDTDHRHAEIIVRYLRELGQPFSVIENGEDVKEGREIPIVFITINRKNQDTVFRLIKRYSHIRYVLVCDDIRMNVIDVSTNCRCISPPVTTSKIIEVIQEFLIGALQLEKPARKEGKSFLFKGTVLVAEDTLASQKLMKIMLEKIGLSVDLASDGKTTVDMFKKKKYRLVFMDINMPEYDGVLATRRILEYEEENGLAHVPIIALTAKAVKGDRERFLAEGMDEYLSKPVNMDTLLRVVRGFLKRKKSKESNKSVMAGEISGAASVLGIDEDVYLDLVTAFLDDGDEYVTALKKAIDENDYAAIEQASHKIKGVAASYFLNKLVVTASTIENAAQNQEEGFDFISEYEGIKKEFSRLKKEFMERDRPTSSH